MFLLRFHARRLSFMTRLRLGVLAFMTFAAAALAGSFDARAQSQGAASSGFLERLFGREGRAVQRQTQPEETTDGSLQAVQMAPTDLLVRLDRLENQIRQLTGAIEQLQYRNQQLEQQLLRAQDADGRMPDRAAEPGGRSTARMPLPPASPLMPAPPVAAPPQGRRSDAFDPAQNPSAPGAPRGLGTGRPIVVEDESPAGAQGGRGAGAPLDLGTMSAQAASGAVVSPPRSDGTSSGGLPPPPPRNPNATGAPRQQLVMAPSNTPKDEFDLAYGYILRKDYALAEESLRVFLEKYPSDRLSADATYWLGESLFQRHRYRDAAEHFLAVSTKHATLAKAPDALLRLGQSLAALKEKDAACATFAEIGRKYPRASPTVRQSAEREHKRGGC